MANAEWTNELYPGATITYDYSSVAYDDATITQQSETFDMNYDTTGVATTWTLENK